MDYPKFDVSNQKDESISIQEGLVGGSGIHHSLKI